MACAVNPAPLALAPLMAPLVTAGFAMTLFTKSVAPPVAIFSLFWYVATYTAFFFDYPVDGRTDFLSWPLGFFLLGSAMASIVSQIGNYPRLIDFVDGLRTTYEAGARVFDRRRTVWEGLVVAVSSFALYYGILFAAGALSDSCLFVSGAVASAVGWVMIIAGAIGIAAVVLVTVFDVNHPANIERKRMWKYALVLVVLVGLQTALNDALYALTLLDSFSVLIGLVPVVLVWVVLYWWILDVQFAGEMEMREAIKMNNDEVRMSNIMDIVQHDGFRVAERVAAFVVTGGLYNVLVVLAIFIADYVSVHSMLATFLTALGFTVVAVVIVIVVSLTTTVYYSNVKRVADV